MPNYDKLSPKAEVHDSDRSPEADLVDTVAHLQLEVEALKFVQSAPPALAKRSVLVGLWTLLETSPSVCRPGRPCWRRHCCCVIPGGLLGTSPSVCRFWPTLLGTSPLECHPWPTLRGGGGVIIGVAPSGHC